MSAMTIGATDASAAAMKVAQSLSNAGASTQGVRSGTMTTASTTTAPPASGAITSNDFLSLLVTEMKNQDPTQPTDPNAYIQQLVGVNSLQQLIAINQDLSNLGAGKTPAAGVNPLPPIGS